MTTTKDQSSLICTNIIDGLCKDGYSVTTNAYSPSTISALKALAQKLRSQGEFKPASIGRAQNKLLDVKIRGDLSCWIKDWNLTQELSSVKDFYETLLQQVKQELYLPVKHTEAHFALYQPGAGYAAHLDQHADSVHRQISLILYLSDQGEKDGGELKLHNSLNQKNLNLLITPKSGMLVCFLSSKIVHEVMPTHKERWSLTGWMRDDLP